MNNNNDITIIIVLYEEIEKVIIENLKNLNNFDVILFDNSNNTKLKKSISKRFNVKKYVLSAKNLGFSRAYNEAIKLCKTEFVLILNADCIIKEESIIKLKQELLNSKDCIMTTPTSYDNL